ncbi:hypothetical protein HK101_004384 [Irineochytrium annulatum]|nr:hypothetical protein HK101_004384 [Irineochytrium annulatum]
MKRKWSDAGHAVGSSCGDDESGFLDSGFGGAVDDGDGSMPYLEMEDEPEMLLDTIVSFSTEDPGENAVNDEEEESTTIEDSCSIRGEEPPVGEEMPLDEGAPLEEEPPFDEEWGPLNDGVDSTADAVGRKEAVVDMSEGVTRDEGKRQKGSKRPCPWYKRIPGTGIIVDAFNYGKIEGCTSYFLSHFHSDHYGGLSSTFSGKIYCSKVTRNLVIMQLRVKPEFVIELPMNRPVDVDGAEITLIDANHCPGAVLFIIRVGGKVHLHTGDFRYDPGIHATHPAIQSIPCFDSVYLDTTYCKPAHCFPPQSAVIKAICDVAVGMCTHQRACKEIVSGAWLPPGAGVTRTRSSMVDVMQNWLSAAPSLFRPEPRKRKETLIVVGTYLIGKERVFKAIAQSINSAVYVDKRKRKILQCLEDDALNDMLTDDPLAANVHVVGMGQLKKEDLVARLKSFASKFDRVLAVRPTGWTYRPGKKMEESNFTLLSLKPTYHDSNVTAIGLPYSEHSSYAELRAFVKDVKAVSYIPTVNLNQVAAMNAAIKSFICQ